MTASSPEPPAPRATAPGASRAGAWSLRPIEVCDEPAMAAVIREVMPEFGAEGPGFALSDPEVGFMHRAYQGPRQVYFVAEREGALEPGQRKFLGGAGVAPLEGGGRGTAELRKMYLRAEGRGLGVGHALLARCVQSARELGFAQLYLETLTGMDAAQALYARFGFERLDAPLGSTGHGGCDRWFLLELDASSSGSAS